MLSTRTTRPLFHAILLALDAHAPEARAEPGRKITELADKVYEIEDPSAGGNTTVIIGDRQVFVVDSRFRPSAAREDIAQIRRWTDKPVAFLLNTHFHNDHNFGNRAYMDAFPAITIVAHVETKREMDRFGPSSARREEEGIAGERRMLESGQGPDGKPLSAEDRQALTSAISRGTAEMAELTATVFQSATMTFDHDFTLDVGHRDVQVKFLGRGNTAGDAVVYLPKERIVVTGDLVVRPIPYILDGYPTEWASTLQSLSQLDATTIVPGHGPIMHDMTYVYLLRDFIQSAVDQMNAHLSETRPAMFQTLDDVKSAVDLSRFRQRFTGSDRNLDPEFNAMSASLIKVIFEEATLR